MAQKSTREKTTKEFFKNAAGSQFLADKLSRTYEYVRDDDHKKALIEQMDQSSFDWFDNTSKASDVRLYGREVRDDEKLIREVAGPALVVLLARNTDGSPNKNLSWSDAVAQFAAAYESAKKRG